MAKCFHCDKENGWILLDPNKYAFYCGDCEEARHVGVCTSSGQLQPLLACPGCGRYGAANVFWGDNGEYFCGGSHRCMP